MPTFSHERMDSDRRLASSSGQNNTTAAVEMPEEKAWHEHGRVWSESSSEISASAVGVAAEQRREMPVDVTSTGVGDEYGGRGDDVRSTSSLGGGRRDVRTEWQVCACMISGVRVPVLVFFFPSFLGYVFVLEKPSHNVPDNR